MYLPRGLHVQNSVCIPGAIVKTVRSLTVQAGEVCRNSVTLLWIVKGWVERDCCRNLELHGGLRLLS